VEAPSLALNLAKNAAAAAVSACVAEAITIPFDTVKVRLQMQKTAEAGTIPKYSGMISTFKTVMVEEGPATFWRGITAGLHRQIIFSGIRVGLYTPVRDAISGPLEEGQNPSLLTKMAAAIITGAIGITIANPTDVVKVRLQNQRNSSVKGDRVKGPLYKGTMDCYRKVLLKEGIKGLWTSWSANVMRNSIINCAELASYDQYK